jgi:hypothetical protein
LVSGTPTQPGDFRVDVTATDSHGIVAHGHVALSVWSALAGTPALARLSVSQQKLSLAGRLLHGRCKPVSRADRHAPRCRRKLQLRVSFDLRAAASITFRFERVTSGRLVKTRCVKPTRTNRRRPRCTRLNPLHGTITRALRAGANTITITRPSLPPGTYKLIATPSGAGHTGRRQQVTITITA